MKIKTGFIVSVLMLSLSMFSQQVADGLSTQITNFTTPIGAGFYNGYNPTGGIPDQSFQGGWQHLLVVRHPNPSNNYQLQIASGMTENDKLFFRKLTSGALTPVNSNWFELATRGKNDFIGNQKIIGNLEIFEESDSKPQGQVATTKSILKLSRNGTSNYSYNENAEFRLGHGGEWVYGSKLDLYINGNGNTSSIPDQHVMTWNFNGNVGIGTTNPKNKLDVKGTIHSQEVKVDMEGWSDFVFKKEYELPTLDEVEKHIKENGHLKDIPNEKEVLENGINLGEMNAKLLQKIEELTLYVIEQEKRNNEQSKEIESLKKEKKDYKSILERLDKIESNSK